MMQRFVTWQGIFLIFRDFFFKKLLIFCEYYTDLNPRWELQNVFYFAFLVWSGFVLNGLCVTLCLCHFVFCYVFIQLIRAILLVHNYRSLICMHRLHGVGGRSLNEVMFKGGKCVFLVLFWFSILFFFSPCPPRYLGWARVTGYGTVLFPALWTRQPQTVWHGIYPVLKLRDDGYFGRAIKFGFMQRAVISPFWGLG